MFAWHLLCTSRVCSLHPWLVTRERWPIWALARSLCRTVCWLFGILVNWSDTKLALAFDDCLHFGSIVSATDPGTPRFVYSYFSSSQSSSSSPPLLYLLFLVFSLSLGVLSSFMSLKPSLISWCTSTEYTFKIVYCLNFMYSSCQYFLLRLLLLQYITISHNIVWVCTTALQKSEKTDYKKFLYIVHYSIKSYSLILAAQSVLIWCSIASLGLYSSYCVNQLLASAVCASASATWDSLCSANERIRVTLTLTVYTSYTITAAVPFPFPFSISSHLHLAFDSHATRASSRMRVQWRCSRSSTRSTSTSTSTRSCSASRCSTMLWRSFSRSVHFRCSTLLLTTVQ